METFGTALGNSLEKEKFKILALFNENKPVRFCLDGISSIGNIVTTKVGNNGSAITRPIIDESGYKLLVQVQPIGTEVKRFVHADSVDSVEAQYSVGVDNTDLLPGKSILPNKPAKISFVGKDLPKEDLWAMYRDAESEVEAAQIKMRVKESYGEAGLNGIDQIDRGIDPNTEM